MKTKLAMLMVVLVMGTPIASAEVSNRNMTVVGLNAITDEVLLSDENGDVWAMHGVEDWMLDDSAKVSIDDKNTADKTDDEIISAVYTR